MRKILLIGFTTAIIMLLLPLSVIKNENNAIPTTALQENILVKPDEISDSTSFKLLNCESNTVNELDYKDYIFGVVAAEMPALYEDEALKAQAIAAYTFALNRKAENSEKNYDITNDHTTDQSFITKEEAANKWGDKATEYTEKIEKAIADVKDYVILYDGKIITSVYHAISGGKTEDSSNVWGVSLPYLKSVSSVGDKLADNYISKAEFTLDQLIEKLNITVESLESDNNIFKNITRTNSGTVKSITVASKKFTGAELRTALELRSSNFEIEFSNNKYTFTVYGYGHGVGMSQNGANYMAKQGFDFKEILTHYYTDCKVEKLK